MPSSPRRPSRPRSPQSDLRAAFVVTVSALTFAAAVAPGCSDDSGTNSGGCRDGAQNCLASNPPAPYQTCPSAMPRLGNACSNQPGYLPYSCDYVLEECGGSTITLRCPNEVWAASETSCPACPAELPAVDTTCSSYGRLCPYQDGDICLELDCYGGRWARRQVSCTPQSSLCPTQLPEEKTPCSSALGAETCSYFDSSMCEIRRTCLSGAWADLSPTCSAGGGGQGGGGQGGSSGGGGSNAGGGGSNAGAGGANTSAGCRAITDNKTCGDAEGCRWLEPGCTEPALPKTGCFPSTPCDATHPCDGGTTCQTVVYDPCAGAECAACGADIAVCL